ncbi:MAG: YihY/virulence factor BrkB family protein [Rickettsiales bacterium]|jgi:membrane protein|nr:YihY/virulence factor BrkB family protein [Rickettsiales bacterium]
MKRLFKIICNFIQLNKNAIENLINHDGVEHAGYMAFVTLISFFPFLIFIMAFTSFIGSSEYGKEMISLLLSNMPDYLRSTLNSRIEEIVSGPPGSLLTLSILGVIWSSSSTVEGLRTILNKIYHVKTPPAYILRRLLSIAQFLIITVILVVAMVILVFIPIIYQKISSIEYLQPIFEITKELSGNLFTPIWNNTRYITLILTIFTGVMFLYKVIPNVKLHLRSIIPGSVLVTLLWTFGGSLMSKYIYVFSQINIVYGGLAGFVLTLLFFYIIHIIFIYGAEVNYLINKNREI